jgi:hypothetical protein
MNYVIPGATHVRDAAFHASLVYAVGTAWLKDSSANFTIRHSPSGRGARQLLIARPGVRGLDKTETAA